MFGVFCVETDRNTNHKMDEKNKNESKNLSNIIENGSNMDAIESDIDDLDDLGDLDDIMGSDDDDVLKSFEKERLSLVDTSNANNTSSTNSNEAVLKQNKSSSSNNNNNQNTLNSVVSDGSDATGSSGMYAHGSVKSSIKPLLSSPDAYDSSSNLIHVKNDKNNNNNNNINITNKDPKQAIFERNVESNELKRDDKETIKKMFDSNPNTLSSTLSPNSATLSQHKRNQINIFNASNLNLSLFMVSK